ncbi:response regulator transcription factor [Desulforhopalus sp. 52FAK]
MKHSEIRAFIVDDNLSYGKSLQRLLDCRGISTDLFDSAETFLDSVPSGQKGIAIIDIHMAFLDGLSLMEQMQVLGYTMPVILITGQTGPSTRDMAMDRGAVGFLQKPFLEKSLMSLIEELQNPKKLNPTK